MPRAYIVTEGDVDAKILRRVLPRNLIDQVKFVVAGGRSRAESLARSLLVSKYLPVALVVDANTADQQSINEQLDFLRDYLDYGSAGPEAPPFSAFLAVPEIEAILLEDKSLVEHVASQTFSDREWELGKYQPKQLLSYVLPNQPDGVEQILAGATEENLERLRGHPLVRDLGEFLSSVLQNAHRP